jgi:hypothetical protein
MDHRVFDTFLSVDTWHTTHPLDDRRFFWALSEVVEDPDFNPEAMGDHFRKVKAVTSDQHPFASRIDSLVSKAWAVREYLEAIRKR